MVNVTLIAPAGFGGGQVSAPGGPYNLDANGLVSVQSTVAPLLLLAGFRFYRVGVVQADFSSALPADLVSISAAASYAAGNSVMTVAAQPPHARKLQVRVVDDGTHHFTAGVVRVVGVDQDGNAITEDVSVITAVSATFKSKFAYAQVTSLNLIGNVGGTSTTTVGVGLSNDFGIPTSQGTVVNFGISKATKTTKVLGTSNVTADDVASTATVDAVARTVAPTTAPAANGLVDYSFVCNYGVAD